MDSMSGSLDGAVWKTNMGPDDSGLTALGIRTLALKLRQSVRRSFTFSTAVLNAKTSLGSQSQVVWYEPLGLCVFAPDRNVAGL